MANDNFLPVKMIYDAGANKVHYQTDPYLDENGNFVIKRLSSHDVQIIQVGETIQEYSQTVKYSEEHNGEK